MTKAGGDRTRSLTRREALRGGAAVPAGVLGPAATSDDVADDPTHDLANIRALMAAFTAAQERAWQATEEQDLALFAGRRDPDRSIGLGPPSAHDVQELEYSPREVARQRARDAVIDAPARTLAAVAAKLRWVAEEYTVWLEEDEDGEDDVEVRAGRRVLADLEALVGGLDCPA